MNRIRWTHRFGVAARALVLVVFTVAQDTAAQPCWTWTRPTVEEPQARSSPAMAYDSVRGRVVLFGGHALSDTWEWDGTSWMLAAASGPPPRATHAMAFDAKRGKVVLFGGRDANSVDFGDTWEWDGNTWSLVATDGPAARAFPAMAFDAARGRTVLFGGSNTAGPLADTWEWDGAVWTERAVQGPPVFYHAMVYDDRREVVVLHGGRDAAGIRRGDTWEWDGSAWFRRTTSGPARVVHSMAFDTFNGRAVMFGGLGAPDGGDTWTWDGVAWRQVSDLGPSRRTNAGMAYDAARGQVVLFGGDTSLGTVGETWVGSGAGPSVAEHPMDVEVESGAVAEFRVTAAGPGQVSYQWYKDGVPIVHAGRVTGMTTNTLLINPVIEDDAGEYHAAVTTGCGDAASEPATLTIRPLCRADYNGSGSVDSSDFFAFLAEFFEGCP